MATSKQLKIDHLLIRNDTAAAWKAANPVLKKGEIGIESDSKRFKIGTGLEEDTWNKLSYARGSFTIGKVSDPTANDKGFDSAGTVPYEEGQLWHNSTNKHTFVFGGTTPDGKAKWTRLANADELTALGYGDMLKSEYDTGEVNSSFSVDSADRWKDSLTIKNQNLRGSDSPEPLKDIAFKFSKDGIHWTEDLNFIGDEQEILSRATVLHTETADNAKNAECAKTAGKWSQDGSLTITSTKQNQGETGETDTLYILPGESKINSNFGTSYTIGLQDIKATGTGLVRKLDKYGRVHEVSGIQDADLPPQISDGKLSDNVMLKKDYDTDKDGKVNKAVEADKWATARTVSTPENNKDGSLSFTIDGSKDVNDAVLTVKHSTTADKWSNGLTFTNEVPEGEKGKHVTFAFKKKDGTTSGEKLTFDGSEGSVEVRAHVHYADTAHQAVQAETASESWKWSRDGKISVTSTNGTIKPIDSVVINAETPATLDIDLATFGTSGTYTKVITDAYGRVKSGEAKITSNDISTTAVNAPEAAPNDVVLLDAQKVISKTLLPKVASEDIEGQLTEKQIPSLPSSKITGLGTAATKDVGPAAGNVPVLGEDGKLNTSVLPSLAITDTFVVATKAELITLEDARTGDVAIVGDGENREEDGTYILSTDSYGTLSDWKRLVTPTDSVTSVNGKTGVVTLTTEDITEKGNLYWTQGRFDERYDARIPETPSSKLSDGDIICRTTDTFTIDCGGAK